MKFSEVRKCVDTCGQFWHQWLHRNAVKLWFVSRYLHKPNKQEIISDSFLLVIRPCMMSHLAQSLKLQLSMSCIAVTLSISNRRSWSRDVSLFKRPSGSSGRPKSHDNNAELTRRVPNHFSLLFKGIYLLMQVINAKPRSMHITTNLYAIYIHAHLSRY